MNYKSAIAAFVGAFLMFAMPAAAQTSVGPAEGEEQGILLALAEREASSISDAAGSTPSIVYADGCPIPAVLAASEYAVACDTSQTAFFQMVYDACAKGRRSPDEGCGAVVYTIDPTLDFEFRRELSLPLTMTVKIGKIAAIDGDLSTMVATVVNSNGSAEQLTPSGINNLLAPIRIDERVLIYGKTGGQKRFDQKRSLDRPVRYFPALFLDADAARALHAEHHLSLPIQIRQDLEKLLNPRCLIYKLSC